MTGRLLWLPAALKGAGLNVNVVGGWETRGRAAMNPRGLILHHTASRTGSNAPSLRICIDGRPDLPGPLCHIVVGRDLTCHVIASGVANHSGTGGWRGLSGNASVIGVECENNGVDEPWSKGMVDVMVQISAACAVAARFDAEMVCGHKEWAPRRKVDPWGLEMRDIRLRIASRLSPRMSEEDDTDMHGTRIIAAYGQAGYLLATLHPDQLRKHWADIDAWTHAIYSKPEHERAGGVAYIRALLGLK